MLSRIVIPSQQTKHERKSKPVPLLPAVGVGEEGETRTDGGRDVPGSCRAGGEHEGRPQPKPQAAEFTGFQILFPYTAFNSFNIQS